MTPIRILDYDNAWSETNRLLSTFVNEYFAQTECTRTFKILEAGCGQKWNLNLEIDFELTGVDISSEAMENRKLKYDDLDKFIVGDLANIEIDHNSYDVIYCSYVLEHLSGAEAVLDRFFQWLKPGGLAILIFPDRDSVFGFVTRLTPHWFHIFYYKYIVKFPNAGLPGYGPFPTVYDSITSRRAIYDFCQQRGYDVALEFATPLHIPKAAGFFAPLISAFVRIVAILSFGRLTDRYNDIAIVIRRP